LASFQQGRVKILVATDVASRGIHVQNIAHVINYDLPDIAENFIHRVGRTGRNGEKGLASTMFCREQRSEIFHMERQLGIKMERLLANDGTAAPHNMSNPTSHAATSPSGSGRPPFVRPDVHRSEPRPYAAHGSSSHPANGSRNGSSYGSGTHSRRGADSSPRRTFGRPAHGGKTNHAGERDGNRHDGNRNDGNRSDAARDNAHRGKPRYNDARSTGQFRERAQSFDAPRTYSDANESSSRPTRPTIVRLPGEVLQSQAD
jgi:superfamily II DNA/RNA helicase